uniref:Ribosomal RNA methyltransferase SPB1-like C-terminal domain-containing protein n=1 Tax=Aplanochytrium stocchinoi TaxID=215587 RepID=A0A7S3PN43_9STRA
MWAFQQLFEKVEATKPASSRNVSAEIFVVCRGYLAPHKIDPKLLDPAHLFEQVEGEKKDAGHMLFHKKNTQKRKREGYDESLGQGLYKSETVKSFLNSKDPMSILAETNDIKWDKSSEPIKQFSVTKPEIIECLKDIKVLGKAELRLLLRWRTVVKKQIQELAELANPATSIEHETQDEANQEQKVVTDVDKEEQIADEIEEQLTAAEKKKRKEKKKTARERVKMQMRRDQGIENDYAVDLSEVNDGPFSLKSLKVKNKDDLDDIREVNLNKADSSQVPLESETGNDQEGLDVNVDGSDDEEEGLTYLHKLEKDMETHHARASHHKDSQEPMTVKQRRQLAAAEKKAKQKKRKLELLQAQDYAKAVEEEEEKELSKGAYLNLLHDNEDDSSDEESDDDEDTETLKPDVKTKQWFDQSLFKGIDEEDNDIKLPSEKTDKHKRHNKRVKDIKQRTEKEERKKKLVAKQARELDDIHEDIKDTKRGFDTVKAITTTKSDDSEVSKEKSKEVKDLIARGIGKINNKPEKAGFEVAPVEETVEEEDDGNTQEPEEEYNSEEYDTDEHAQNLALGALLAKKSSRRKVLDAAYNRYAFNDNDLPPWFVEDENKHNRPQVPITKAMVDAVKSRYKDLAAKPMNKVAEARARKKRKITLKVEAAKRKATSVADAPDMSARSKMRAIAKIYKGTEVKKPNSVYVVAKKSSKGQVSVKGSRQKGAKVKLVDKRLRADQSRGNKKRSKGKTGGRKRKR